MRVTKNLGKILLVLGVLVLIVVILYFVTYNNLNVGEQAQDADVIVVFEGGPNERADKSIQLLQNGYSSEDALLVSPYFKIGGTNAENIYLSKGAPEESLYFEYDATSTWTNATNTLNIMEEKGWDSALVVTTDYHTRRSRLSLDRAMGDRDYDITMVSAYGVDDNGVELPYDDHPHHHKLAEVEVFKYWAYLLGLYHFIDL